MTSRTWGPDGSGIPISSANLNGIEADITAATNTANAAIPASQKGAASGVASLDASTKVPAAQLPAATATAAGAVQLTGDLGGTAASPTVPGLASRVQIGGDLAGTATAPTVAKVNGVSVTGTPSNGQVLTASSATAAAWATPSGGGGYTGLPIFSGDSIHLNPGSSATAAGPAVGSVQGIPVYLPSSITIQTIVVEVTTAAAAGGTAVLGYYTRTAGSTLTLQATFGTITTTTTGTKSLTGPWTLPAGTVFLAILSLTAAATYRAVTQPVNVPGWYPYNGQAFLNENSSFRIATGASALPATGPGNNPAGDVGNIRFGATI